MGTSMASFAHFVMASFWVSTMLSWTLALTDVARFLWTPTARIGYFVAKTFSTSACGGISLAIAGSGSCTSATRVARLLGLSSKKGPRALFVY